MKQVTEQHGVWKLTHTKEFPLSFDKDVVEEISLEALGQRIRIRKLPDGTVEILGLPKPKRALGGLTLEQMEAVAAANPPKGWAGNVTLAEIRSTLNDCQTLRTARRGLMLALRKAGATYPQIGAFLERSHSTVIQTIQGSERRRAAPASGPEAV